MPGEFRFHSISQHFTDTLRKNAVRVGYGGDDSGYEVVLGSDDIASPEDPVVGRRPKMNAGTGVDRLNRDPKH